MKKVVIGIVIAIIIIAMGAGAYFMLNSNKEKKSDNLNQNALSLNDNINIEKENTSVMKNENTENSNNQSKTLVVYFSAQNHTKAVAEKIADKLDADIFEIIPEDKYTSDEKDLMLMGLLLHDGLKLGKKESKYTQFDHPILMANFIEEEKEHLELTDQERKLLCDMIKTHMGPWTQDYQGREVLEKPKTKYQNFVHMCDFLASRKCILIPFDEEDCIAC